MSNNLNIDNVSGFGQIRTPSQGEVKKSVGEVVKPIEVAKTNPDDKLEFSNRGSEVGRLVDQIKSIPDSREDKVNAIREQVSSGNYNPSSLDIADAILKDEKI